MDGAGAIVSLPFAIGSTTDDESLQPMSNAAPKMLSPSEVSFILVSFVDDDVIVVD
jgi:hypothetical protein